jgi:hypothetical protein
MSEIEQAQALLRELAAVRFYGSVEVRFDNGKITVIKKTESIKPKAIPETIEDQDMNNPAVSPIEALRLKILECLEIPEVDHDVIDFTFAVYASNRFPGDPLWGLIVDASGGGKTELLRSLRDEPDAYFVSKLSEKSLKSGYRDPKSPSKDPSLLPQLDGKILVIKDLSPILSMRRESRNNVIGDLRDAYDGFSDDAFGNVGKVAYKSKFSLLAAATLAVEKHDGVDQELGERFVKFRGRGKKNRQKVRRAIANVGADENHRHKLRDAVVAFLRALPKELPQKFPEYLWEPLAIVSDLTATARSHVARDRNHKLCYAPRPEVGTRLGKQLSKLLLALAYIRGKCEPDMEDFATICRVAEDCLPPNRREVLAAICADRKSSLPDSTTRDTIADLKELGICGADGTVELGWRKALSDLRKLFSTPTLLGGAPYGVSEIFIGNGFQCLSSPPYTAHPITDSKMNATSDFGNRPSP